MKKIFVLFLSLILILSFTACGGLKIEVGKEDGVAYFHYSQSAPTMYLSDVEKIEINNDDFFTSLVEAIDGRPITDPDKINCNCSPIYTVLMDNYHFGIHDHAIQITASVGGGRKHRNHLGLVECDPQTIEGLLTILDNAK